MSAITITLTDRQARAVASLDARRTAAEIVQTHVDTWLGPVIGDIEKRELKILQDAYAKADDETRAKVREELLARANQP